MADEASAMQGTSASVAVAEVPHISVEGISTKQDNCALLRISQALHGLMGSLMNSLEFRDVGSLLELEISDGIVNGSPDEALISDDVEVRPKLLLVVARTLKEIVGALVSDIKVLESPVPVFPDPYKVVLFATPDNLLLFADNCEIYPEEHHQLIGLYDADEVDWDIPAPFPSGSNSYSDQLETLFLSELRWNVTP